MKHKKPRDWHVRVARTVTFVSEVVVRCSSHLDAMEAAAKMATEKGFEWGAHATSEIEATDAVEVIK